MKRLFPQNVVWLWEWALIIGVQALEDIGTGEEKTHLIDFRFARGFGIFTAQGIDRRKNDMIIKPRNIIYKP